MSFASAILALSPVFYLRLGETSGTNAVDEVGEVTATYTGTYTQGATSLVPTDGSNAALNVGGSGYVHVTQETALNLTGAFTLIGVVKFSASQLDKNICGKFAVSASQQSYAIYVDGSSANKLGCIFKSGAAYNSVVTTSTYNDGNAHLVIGRRSGANMKLVVANTDGSIAETITKTDASAGSIASSASGIRIGNWTDQTTSGFNGDLDEIALLNTEISDSQILNLIAEWSGVLGGTATQGRAGRLWALDAPSTALIGKAGRLWSLAAVGPAEGKAGRLWALLASAVTQGKAGRLWSLLAEPITSPTATLVTYTCRIEGAADSLPDLILPISSFQGAFRSGRPSFLSVQVPNALVYTDDIIARPNGALTVTRNVIFTDGSSESVEIARVNPPTIRTDRGARSSTITLSGEKQTTNSNPRSVAIGAVSYRALQVNSKRRFRAALNNNLRAGDEAVIDVTGETITVDTVQYTVGPSQADMEIIEV